MTERCAGQEMLFHQVETEQEQSVRDIRNMLKDAGFENLFLLLLSDCFIVFHFIDDVAVELQVCATDGSHTSCRTP